MSQCENLDEETEEKLELESHFILRLPPADAAFVTKYLRKKPKKIKKYLKIDVNPETRKGEVRFRKNVIPMKLVDLPTIVESLKSHNNQIFLKTADICQMLIPDISDEENDNNNLQKKHLWRHGLTPPLKNIRKQRFRKILKNPKNTEVEKEIGWLLKMDKEAISVRWELTEDPDSKTKYESEPYYELEKELFGDVSSETESDTDL